MSEIKGVLFDYGGVLTRAGVPGSSLRKLAELLELEEAYLHDAFYEAYPRLSRGLMEAEEFWVHLASRMARNLPDNRARYWLRHDLLEHDPEMSEVIADIRSAGLPTGIVSNVFGPIAVFLRDQGGYDGYDPVILSSEVGFAKPEPEIYRIALERIGLAAHEVVFIDDMERNLQAARELGMATILSPTPAVAARGLRARLGI